MKKIAKSVGDDAHGGELGEILSRMRTGSKNEKKYANRIENVIRRHGGLRKDGVRSLSELEKDGDILIAFDDTFRVCLVYLYGTFDEFNDMRLRLFGYAKELPQAHGYTSHDTVLDLKTQGVIVWVNSIEPKNGCIACLVHELSHLADFISEATGTDDKSGEEKAYVMQREILRVADMFGIHVNKENTLGEIRRIIDGG